MGHPVIFTFGSEKLQLRLNEHIHRFKDSWECKRHSNAEFELHIILRGSCELEIEDRRFSMEANRAVIIPPGQYHLPRPAAGEFERFTMSFSLEQGPVRDALQAAPAFVVTEQIAALCQSIFRESANDAPFRREMLQALMMELMLCVLRCLGVEENHPPQPPVEVSEQIQRLDDFFELHMADDAGAEELARQLHISRRQLARILQKTYGMGFREKRIRTRMDHAAWLLRNTADPVSRIAEAVGYASETAFYQAFQSQFGQTPRQYRGQSTGQRNA